MITSWTVSAIRNWCRAVFRLRAESELCSEAPRPRPGPETTSMVRPYTSRCHVAGLRADDSPARIDSMNRNDVSWLVPITLGTLILFYLVWAAMHDIAHGDQGTLEWTFLALSLPAFALLYRQALRLLPSKAKAVWLTVTGIVISLFVVGSGNSLLQPKYPKDPMLATVFLAAGLPALGLITYHLIRSSFQKRI